MMVDARAPGLSTRLLTGFMGWVGEVTFEDVEVPADAVLGEVGEDGSRFRGRSRRRFRYSARTKWVERNRCST